MSAGGWEWRIAEIDRLRAINTELVAALKPLTAFVAGMTFTQAAKARRANSLVVGARAAIAKAKP